MLRVTDHNHLVSVLAVQLLPLTAAPLEDSAGEVLNTQLLSIVSGRPVFIHLAAQLVQLLPHSIQVDARMSSLWH